MKIGILQTGYAPDAIKNTQGDYDTLFHRLLDDPTFEFETYLVLEGKFPKSVDECDGWLVTGSKHGVYEDHAWIPPLEDLIREIATAQIPLVGICFGHQIIAQALGGHVEKFDGGWSVGLTQYDLGDRAINLNAWHQDQVITPPTGAKTLASSPFCKHAVLAYGDHIYTTQPHPEFDTDVIDGLIRTRGKGVVPDDLLEQATENLKRPDDNGYLKQTLISFFKNKGAA